MRSFFARCFGVLAFCLAMRATVNAQQFPAPGKRVRVVNAASRHALLTGALIRISGDTLVIETESGARGTQLLDIEKRLEVSAGTHRRTVYGIAMGFLAGTAAGVLVGFASYTEADCQNQFLCLDFGPGFAAAAGGIVGGGAGMVIGGILGAQARTDTWHRVEPPAIQVGIIPTSFHGARLSASIRF